jgi:unsaturated rhamnogalacturonyl hydrolase
MKRRPLLSRRWHYEPGVALTAIRELWLETGEGKYYDYVKRNIDESVDVDGSIRTYRLKEYNLDQINEGKLLFMLYETSGDERYKRAIHLLRKQLQTQPRTGEGGFWHKQIYPHQMWLDGIYMASPFYAEFGSKFGETAAFDDVVHQILLIEKHTRDPETGLLYHGWDESREQKWADPTTGRSSSFWGRAIGWYAMAIVDVLDHLPQAHPQRDALIKILEATVRAAVGVQDPVTGVWYQVLDQGDRPGNYLEASVSCMFVYAMAKGIRKGYLDHAYLSAARIAFLRRILEAGPAQGIDPLRERWRIACTGVEGEYYLCYCGGNRQSARWQIDSPEDARFTIGVIDTWKVTITPLEGPHCCLCEFPLPGKPHIALRIRKVA